MGKSKHRFFIFLSQVLFCLGVLHFPREQRKVHVATSQLLWLCCCLDVPGLCQDMTAQIFSLLPMLVSNGMQLLLFASNTWVDICGVLMWGRTIIKQTRLTSQTFLCPPLIQWSITPLNSFIETPEGSGAPSRPRRVSLAFLKGTMLLQYWVENRSSWNGLLNFLTFTLRYLGCAYLLSEFLKLSPIQNFDLWSHVPLLSPPSCTPLPLEAEELFHFPFQSDDKFFTTSLPFSFL